LEIKTIVTIVYIYPGISTSTAWSVLSQHAIGTSYCLSPTSTGTNIQIKKYAVAPGASRQRDGVHIGATGPAATAGDGDIAFVKALSSPSTPTTSTSRYSHADAGDIIGQSIGEWIGLTGRPVPVHGVITKGLGTIEIGYTYVVASGNEGGHSARIPNDIAGHPGATSIILVQAGAGCAAKFVLEV
jgi:hypothetical protein